MLVKRIDLGSIPNGLYVAGEDIEKGRAVVLKNGKLYKPTTKEEAGRVMGLATLAIDTKEGGDVADHNVIKAGTRPVVYTLVSGNMWGTTEFVDGINVGDDLAVSYTGADAGKLMKAGVDDTPLFTAEHLGKAGSYDLLDFYVK